MPLKTFINSLTTEEIVNCLNRKFIPVIEPGNSSPAPSLNEPKNEVVVFPAHSTNYQGQVLPISTFTRYYPRPVET